MGQVSQETRAGEVKPEMVTERSAARPVSLRALVIGLCLIPINLYWLINIEYVRYSDNVSTSALFFNAIFLLLVLLLVNLVIGRISPAKRLARGELMTVYVMVIVSTGLAGHDQMSILFSTMHFAIARANVVNGWTQSIIPNLPAHLVPPAGTAVADLYRGQTTLYMPEHYLPWLRPLGWWSLFIVGIVWVMLCMTSMFRRQWDAERLSYPIAEIPLQITDVRTQLFQNKLFWGAFLLAAIVRLWVVGHLVCPSIPELPVNVRYITLGQNLPWVAAGMIPICVFPFAIGLCFFLPTQLSFSVWFFAIVARMEQVGAAAVGRTDYAGGFPYIAEQSAGAAIGMALMVIWYARAHLKRIWTHATGGPKLDDRDEPMPYSLALWGFFGGCSFLVLFAVAAGMRMGTAVVYMSILLLLVLAIARLRAEVGIPTIELYMTGADAMMRSSLGDAFWTHQDLTVMSLFFFLGRTHRQFPMNSHVDAMRLGDKTGVKLGSMTVAILLASVMTVVTAFWLYLHIMYKTGYDSANYFGAIHQFLGGGAWDRLNVWIQSPAKPDPGRFGGYVFGALFTFFLSVMRMKFIGWPFHPAGYLVSGCMGVNRFWVPMLIAWSIKAPILRYGGLKMYRKAVPFFIGLILGEFVLGMLVTLLSFCGIHFPAESGIGGL